MEYYIDGHNLIPKLQGIRLSDDHDEQDLLERIQEYARLTRKKCTVFFDKAPDNRTRDATYGTVHVVYVTHHTKADEEIISRVNKAGKNRAAEITVVSSDQHVQWQCHQAGAKTIESEKFASGMNQVFSGHSDSIKGNSKGTKTPQRIEPKLSQKEVDEWLEIFRERK